MDNASLITSATHATTAGGGGTSGTTNKKKVDDRVKVLLEDCARKKHRSIFLLLGDRSKDQITAIHSMVSRCLHTARVSVLWCMKSEPLFVSTAKSKMRRQGAREVKAGMASEESQDAFEAFLSHNDIRFTHYKDTHRVLGQTFGMAILQDFEAMTPNILARTIETVSGGGAILILLRSMSSLRQLHTLTMDVHSRYRSNTHGNIIPRFNERFLLSLCDCENMIALDDDLAVLPITSNIKNMLQVKRQAANSTEERLRLEGRTKHEADLADLKARLKEHQVVGPLVGAASTVDQAKTILGLMQAVAEKTLNGTCAVTAARGRGKSAALGLVLAGAVREGYSNILVTAPGPDNLQTLFEFAVRGLRELGYIEKTDFSVMLSTNPEFAKCTVAIQVFRDHRQTIQFVAATDSEHFRHAEILVVDEAAAIPLPLVQRMIGPYLVFLASTVSGYEGTGRSLSLKLIADMKKRSSSSSANSNASSSSSSSSGQQQQQQQATARFLRELKMQDPIRYGPDDPVEFWLSKLLCFDACSDTPISPSGVPHPSKCELFYVERDALFSYHQTAEALLHKVMALLVAAHYKNQPNDLQLLSDAPGHHLFVLCAPPNSGSSSSSSSDQQQQNQQNQQQQQLPDILAVIHACEEGNVASDQLAANLDRGSRPSGDLIPYTIAQQYLEKSFPRLAGMRVVRIATNPEIQRSGYGTRALNLLMQYYEGKFVDVNNNNNSDSSSSSSPTQNQNQQQQQIAPRKTVPTLMKRITNRPPMESAEYFGVSFGLNTELYNFWNRNGFDAIYLRQVPNELTAEHSCVMVRPLVEQIRVFDFLRAEFRRRFLPLLPMSFRHLSVDLAVCLVSGANGKENYAETVSRRKGKTSSASFSRDVVTVCGTPQLSWKDLTSQASITEADLQRLKLYASGVSDVAMILDLVPALASLYFRDMFHFRPFSGNEGVSLTPAQRAILLAVALQGRYFDDLANDRLSGFFGIAPTQLKGVFHKAVGKFVDHFEGLKKEGREYASSSSFSQQKQKKQQQQQNKNNSNNNNNNNNDDENDEQEEEGEGDDEDDEEEEVIDEEEIRRDAKGNIVGMQIVRRVKRKVETDSTLLRDAQSATMMSGAAESQQQQQQQQKPKGGHHSAKRRGR